MIDDTNKGDSFGSMQGLESQLRAMKEEEEKNRPLTKWERKKARIFGESKTMQKNFLVGFAMGGGIGACMGGIMGTYAAITYRQMSIIPMAMLSSGCSFGFFMGLGAVLRANA